MAFGVYLRLLGEAKSIEEYNKSAPVPQFHLREMNSEGWIVEIQGPMDSAFEGRTVQFELTFTEEYPFVPPMIRCLDEMEGTSFQKNELLPFEGFSHDEWSHTIKVVQILLTIQGIMGTTKKKPTKDAENHRAASPQHEESLRPMPIYQESTQSENENQEVDDYQNLEIVDIKSEQERSPEKTKEEPTKRRVRKRSAKNALLPVKVPDQRKLLRAGIS
ncbi:Oidioi.mRNA.OKI2018_I69.PAR.g12660.t1.cds [Oikopleura dioica]|uniref:Oidioi.mRNA.OKI2018_I69.PAR.g12660.t1.cds n=1 Tax=Oikopleura dioica TaxID=34765 RepID=A0ABN7S4G3_OIKDI|nr:Oidioi.mRNA.OKI2018_I69.PAR.g12660.t1.cds [Oikopleura dioica]